MGLFTKFIDAMKSHTTYIGGPGTDAYKGTGIRIENNELCSAIIDCNATHIARGQVLHVIKDKEGRVVSIRRNSEYSRLFQNPNPMMTRQDFLSSMAWQLQETNIAIAWVKWSGAHPVEIWPLIYLGMEVRERMDGGYAVEFTDMDGTQYTIAMEDLVVIRRKYNGIGYTGQDNSSIKESLEMVESLDEGLKQAVTISNKIHGLLKQKKSMLAGESVEKSQKEFISRMQSAAKDGGIVALDSMEDYTPLNVSAWTANAAQQKQITERVYTYWRTPVEVVNNTASEQVMQNYYDSIVEPVWEEMAEAFTNALFTRNEQAHGSCIIVTSRAATGASWQTKLMILTNTKDVGLLSKNEQRDLIGYGPTEDGDETYVSLNYVKASDMSKYQVGDDGKEPKESSEEGDQGNEGSTD